jgi:mRNA interferase RelE/StbE
MPPYAIEFKPSADKALKRLPAEAQRRIVAAVERLAENPRPTGAVKLQGEERTYRLRVGDYRVIYDIHDEMLIVVVLRVAHRKDAYRRS